MATIEKSKEECLTRFGFSFDRGGTHLARSIMFDDISQLIMHHPDTNATLQNYDSAVRNENCLGKRTARGRQLTLRYLKSLYILDPNFALFRAMRYFWIRDPAAQPLLAVLVAYARDSILRRSSLLIQTLSCGAQIGCRDMEEHLDHLEQGRYSPETLRAASQRTLATWVRSGHLTGHIKKTRSTANATPGSASLALFMGYIAGGRGQTLFETEYCKLLDCTPDRIIELAESASRKGWIVCKRIGNVIEVLFPNLLTPEEQEWVHEQS